MAKKRIKKFIQKAIRRPGTLTKAAKAAGKSIDAFCNSGGLSPLMKRKCNLYQNVLKPAAKKRKK